MEPAAGLMGIDELAAALGAAALGAAALGATETAGAAARWPAFSSVAIDSRKVTPGALFVALRGSSTDGHAYIDEAFRAGAAAALAARGAAARWDLAGLARRWGRPVLVVEDTLQGLQDAARAYVRLKAPEMIRVGITGSSGKTTTKEIAAAILAQAVPVVTNRGNLNSETGLPLSLFEAMPGHRVGIFEAGMNRRGEIRELAAALRPHAALITGIGSAHVGLLGSRAAIAAEKREIFSAFTGSETALVPADDPFADFLAEGVRGAVVRYGPGTLPEWGGTTDRGLDGTEIVWAGTPCLLPLPGAVNARNAAAALALVRALEPGIHVSDEAIRRGLESARPLFGRGEILRGPVTVVRDCYNANPESAEAAVAFCDALDWPGRRVYVAGSMLELGDAAGPAHRRLGETLAASRADVVLLYGPETRAALDGFFGQRKSHDKKILQTDDFDELAAAVRAEVRPGDLVLLKGSRGCALERLEGAL